jgi:hypothetical protein
MGNAPQICRFSISQSIIPLSHQKSNMDGEKTHTKGTLISFQTLYIIRNRGPLSRPFPPDEKIRTKIWISS